MEKTIIKINSKTNFNYKHPEGLVKDQDKEILEDLLGEEGHIDEGRKVQHDREVQKIYLRMKD